MKWGFDSGELDEDLVENADGKQFLFSMDNGRKIVFREDENADLLSGNEGITMITRVSGGHRAKFGSLSWFLWTKTLHIQLATFLTLLWDYAKVLCPRAGCTTQISRFPIVPIYSSSYHTSAFFRYGLLNCNVYAHLPKGSTMNNLLVFNLLFLSC